MNDRQQLQQLISASIPLSEFMQFEISELTDNSIRTRAPLQTNINIHGSAFAGSLYSLSMLTAWAMLTHRLRQHAIDTELVAARADIRYRKPVTGQIDCHATLEPGQTEVFIRQLQRKGRARMEVEVIVGDGAAIMTALMVATLKPS